MRVSQLSDRDYRHRGTTIAATRRTTARRAVRHLGHRDRPGHDWQTPDRDDRPDPDGHHSDRHHSDRQQDRPHRTG